MVDNEGIRAEEIRACLLCGQQGHTLHGGLRDRLFGAPGVWGLLRCDGCGLVWLQPHPVREDIAKLYANYSTHRPETTAAAAIHSKIDRRHEILRLVKAARFGYSAEGLTPFSKRLGKWLGLVPLFRDWAGSTVMFLPRAPGRLIDVGSGDGHFLAAMRAEGWEVMGVEFDPEAADGARRRFGIEVLTGDLESATLPDCSANAVTMHHVIEHVPEPLALFRECVRVLRPGGTLVVMTPNADSMGHKRFGPNWRGLEPPRHLCLFSPRTLRVCAQKAGLTVSSVRTISRLAREIYLFSKELRHGEMLQEASFRPGRLAHLQAWSFLLGEEVVRLLHGNAGEEVVLIATR